MHSEFAQDVLRGLAATPKRLFSKYFYDERGSQLFRQIMQLDEYYLTRREYELLETHKTALLTLFQGGTAAMPGQGGEGNAWHEEEPFELIEFGAGDGLKVKILLRFFLAQGARFRYLPIDISKDALDGLLDDLRKMFPSLDTEGVEGDYFEALRILKDRSQTRKIILFLGANIGNFNDEEAVRFLSRLRENLNPDDLLMIGFDLKKDPARVLAAYNDAQGVTREFNLNLLRRINTELGGNFDLKAFRHYPTYDPVSGEARSYLVSTRPQTVHLSQLNATFNLEAWEPIHTEISRKYDLGGIARLAARSGFQIVHNYFDPAQDFVDTVWGISPATPHHP